MNIDFRKLRENKNLTQKEVSDQSGLTVQTIVRLEQGKGNPTIKTISKLLKLYGYKIVIKRTWHWFVLVYNSYR